MSLIVYGINHKSAPIRVREQVALLEPDLPRTLLSLTEAGVQECVILSTCNRTEFYCRGTASLALNNWFGEHHDYIELFHDEAAVRHIMSVACGLDSMVLGERSLLGQMKRVCALA